MSKRFMYAVVTLPEALVRIVKLDRFEAESYADTWNMLVGKTGRSAVVRPFVIDVPSAKQLLGKEKKDRRKTVSAS